MISDIRGPGKLPRPVAIPSCCFASEEMLLEVGRRSPRASCLFFTVFSHGEQIFDGFWPLFSWFFHGFSIVLYRFISFLMLFYGGHGKLSGAGMPLAQPRFGALGFARHAPAGGLRGQPPVAVGGRSAGAFHVVLSHFGPFSSRFRAVGQDFHGVSKCFQAF